MASQSLPVLDIEECCAVGLSSPLEREDAERLAEVVKALADPTRLQLLALVRAADAGEACVCELTEALNLSQPTISHHLKVMTEVGLLAREKRGTWSWFRLRPEALVALRQAFS
jgi:ArsR family transcriptional regulator